MPRNYPHDRDETHAEAEARKQRYKWRDMDDPPPPQRPHSAASRVVRWCVLITLSAACAGGIAWFISGEPEKTISVHDDTMALVRAAQTEDHGRVFDALSDYDRETMTHMAAFGTTIAGRADLSPRDRFVRAMEYKKAQQPRVTNIYGPKFDTLTYSTGKDAVVWNTFRARTTRGGERTVYTKTGYITVRRSDGSQVQLDFVNEAGTIRFQPGSIEKLGN